jgi:hypothetical protein
MHDERLPDFLDAGSFHPSLRGVARVSRCERVSSDYTSGELDEVLTITARLLATERARGAIAVDERRRPRGFGFSVFVREDVTEAYLARPHAQIGKRILRDPRLDDITLDEREIGCRNAGDGLDLVVINQGFDVDASYAPPRLCFTTTERRLLRAALSGAPDSTVGRELAISVTAVKARWGRLLERAEANHPELGRRLLAHKREGTRGPRLRHIVIDHVRHHPSELTPYSPDLPTRYSSRMAISGSMAADRRAGRSLAAMATPTSSSGAAAARGGTPAPAPTVRPNSVFIDASTLASPAAAATPSTAPIDTMTIASRMTSRSTLPRSAPSATRIPISLRRRTTVCAVTPASPIEASPIANVPSSAYSVVP